MNKKTNQKKGFLVRLDPDQIKKLAGLPVGQRARFIRQAIDRALASAMPDHID